MRTMHIVKLLEQAAGRHFKIFRESFSQAFALRESLVLPIKINYRFSSVSKEVKISMC